MTPGITRPYRIAVVDDNQVNRRILVKMLKKYFDHVVEEEDVFEDGWECLKGMACREFDLILLDIEMPIVGEFGYSIIV